MHYHIVLFYCVSACRHNDTQQTTNRLQTDYKHIPDQGIMRRHHASRAMQYTHTCPRRRHYGRALSRYSAVGTATSLWGIHPMRYRAQRLRYASDYILSLPRHTVSHTIAKPQEKEWLDASLPHYSRTNTQVPSLGKPAGCRFISYSCNCPS